MSAENQEPKDNTQLEALVKLRVPFEAHHISKKPQPTKWQTEEVKKDPNKGVRCDICGAWHHPKVAHLDYVGHAAITHRLLDVDPLWSWEPVAYDAKGLPALDTDGGMWIRLTVCGMTRLGYGDAQGKTGPDAMKERIGDALRNAGMRFGMALDLWHKGVLEMDPDRFEQDVETNEAPPRKAEGLPECTAEKFKENEAAWKAVITSGKKTAANLIATLGTKTVLSDDQKKTIQSWDATAQ